jgi:hypothetical protein
MALFNMDTVEYYQQINRSKYCLAGFDHRDIQYNWRGTVYYTAVVHQ